MAVRRVVSQKELAISLGTGYRCHWTRIFLERFHSAYRRDEANLDIRHIYKAKSTTLVATIDKIKKSKPCNVGLVTESKI